VLDVRERDAYESGHVPGARLLPRGQLELRVNESCRTRRAASSPWRVGRISTLAAATLRQLGFRHVRRVDGG